MHEQIIELEKTNDVLMKKIENYEKENDDHKCNEISEQLVELKKENSQLKKKVVSLEKILSNINHEIMAHVNLTGHGKDRLRN